MLILFILLSLRKIGKTGEFMKKYFPASSQISLERIVVKTPTTYTLYNDILRIARNFLETRENIKIDNGHFGFFFFA